MGKVLVVAGEVSGDMHAARVVKEMKELAPGTVFAGMGSSYLEAEGVEILIDPTDVSTIGFAEVFKNLKIHLAHLKLLKEYMKWERPDVVFLVDYSGFNMMMARTASKKGLPVVNYFSPSAWIWGRWRANWMARYGATIASVFPMEEEIYRQAGAEVEFVGHPLVDLVTVAEDKEEIFTELELDSSRTVIGLLPGSRKQEIECLLPEMLKFAERLQQKKAGVQFVLPLAAGINRDAVAKIASNYNLILKLVEQSTYQVMKISDLLIAASGTATLEAALIGTPMIIVYQTSWSTYQLVKKLVELEYVGLPNIIAGKEVVPELLQEEANSDIIFQEAVNLLDRPFTLKRMKDDLQKVKEKMGPTGAVKRTAELVLKKGKLL